MHSDSDAGLIGSDEDGGVVLFRPVSHELDVLVEADEQHCVRGLAKATRRSLEELASSDAPQTASMGLAHLRWSVASSLPTPGPLGWARELAAMRRSMGVVTH